jgi:hypothetical protein
MVIVECIIGEWSNGIRGSRATAQAWALAGRKTDVLNLSAGVWNFSRLANV